MAGSHEVRGSIPLGSTIETSDQEILLVFYFFLQMGCGKGGLSFKKCVLLDYSLPVIRGHVELLPNDAPAVLLRHPILSF